MTYGIGDVIKDAVTGKLQISPGELAQQRYAICNACPVFNSTIMTCGDCGCFMPAKTKLKEATCPRGKW